MKRSKHGSGVNAIQMVPLVQARPVLWDSEARGYRSKTLKEEAWKEVASEFGVSASVVRKKWKNLKDTYRKEYKKEFSDWHLYSKLAFIAGQFPQKETEDVDEDGSDDEETARTKHKKKYKENTSTKKVRIDMDKLIELVKVREPIWDKDDRRHHNSYKLDELWGEIADELGCTRVLARNKWKHLRDNLRRELRKTHSDWAFFPKLAFLYPQFSMVSYFPDEDEDNEGNNEDPIENAEEYNNFYEEAEQTSEEETEQMEDIKPAMTEFNDIEASTSKSKTESPVLSMMGDMLDEDVSFFNSLLPHVKKLNSEKKMVLRMKIQEMVYNVVYGGGKL